ncbi:hypothetical protein ACSQ67_016438 [Phaseolus vulgaris]
MVAFSCLLLRSTHFDPRKFSFPRSSLHSFRRRFSVKSGKVYNGFVNEVATFIVTDDLVVIPNAVDTSFGVLQKFGVKSLSSVQEMSVNVTKSKVLDLLKCSLLSKSTLTDLFLVQKPLLNNSSFYPSMVENSSTMTATQIKVKVVMRKSDGKVMFAQGDEEFVDFLFSFLTFPLGGVVRMLEGYSSIGSIDGLYNSIIGINENKYLTAKEVKNRLIDPVLAPQYKLSMQMFPINEQDTQYKCDRDRNHFYIANRDESSDINTGTSRVLKLVPLKSSGGIKGYFKGPAMFMATDDLVIERMSPTSAVDLLNRLKTRLNDVEEKVVTIGIKEGLGILKASLTSRSALTNGLSHLLLLPELMEQKCWYHVRRSSIATSDHLQIVANTFYEDLESLAIVLESFSDKFSGISLELFSVKVNRMQQMKLVDPKSPSAGLLKTRRNFPATIVTDDLFLAPTSRDPGDSMVDRLEIPHNNVIVKEVTIGVREGHGILMASLTSNSALTNGLSHLIDDIFEENGC